MHSKQITVEMYHQHHGLSTCVDIVFATTAISKVSHMLGILRRNFREMDVHSFISLYKVFVRSHLEYAKSVWNPHYMYLIDDLEKVQKRATKILRQCRRLNYRQRLTGSI